MNNKAKKKLMSRDIDTEDISLEDVLQSLHLDINTYIEALKVSQGTSIILKWNVQDVL